MTNQEIIEKLREESRDCNVDNQEAIQILEKLEQQETRLSKEQIMRYAQRIKPVMRGTTEKVSPELTDNPLFWIPSYPISTTSYAFGNEKNCGKAEGLVEVARIKTYHRYGGYHMFLRPSTDEAIVQCPLDVIDQVCAFEIIQPSDLSIYKIYDAQIDRHVLETVYYKGELPAEIVAQEVRW